MDVFIKYGWYALLAAIIGEMTVPLILALFYKGYSGTATAISVLGNENSPVRLPFNLWTLFAGLLLLSATPGIYHTYYPVSKTLSLLMVLFIAIFAVGACIFSCFFSVGESKAVVSTATKIHGAGSAIGFMLLLFVPLLLALLSFKKNDSLTAILSLSSFALALLFFVLFIMADKPEFGRTIIAKEGLWQRLNLLFMYLPLGFIAVRNILFAP